jgi:hypothetical protein
MYTKNIIVFFGLISFAFFSCQSNNTSAKKAEEQVVNPAGANPYPRPPDDLLMNLYNNCSAIDYTFNNMPASISQEEKASIQSMISFFSQKTPETLNTSCKPMGRAFYQINGEIVLEADFYFRSDCQYFIFFIDGKAMYSCEMSQSGAQFFSRMLVQIQGTTKPSN